VLDLIPVDLVAAGSWACGRPACATVEQRVFPARFRRRQLVLRRRSVELVALYKRRKMEERVEEGKRSAFENWIDTFLEPYPLPRSCTSPPARRSSAPPPRDGGS